LPVDLDPEQIAADNRNDHAFCNRLEQLAPLFRVVVHAPPRLSGTEKNRNGGSRAPSRDVTNGSGSCVELASSGGALAPPFLLHSVLEIALLA
jgi:hypothetical protein